MLKEMNKFYKTAIAFITAFPLFASAALEGTGNIFASADQIITQIIVPLVFTLALLMFFWGVVKYIRSDDKEEGKKIMVWGIIALFVMSSVWGLVYFIRTELDINDDTNMPIPTIER